MSVANGLAPLQSMATLLQNRFHFLKRDFEGKRAALENGADSGEVLVPATKESNS